MDLKMVAWWGSPIYLDPEILLSFSILATTYFTTIQNTMDPDNPPDYNQTILQVCPPSSNKTKFRINTSTDLNKPQQRPQHIWSPVTAVPSHPADPQGLSSETRQ